MRFHIEERQPDGTFEPKTYELDFDQLTNDDIGALEDETGWSYKEFTERCQNLEMRATTAQVWLAKRTVDPEAKFADLVFRLMGMELEASTAELRAGLESLVPGAERDAYIASLTDEQKEAMADLLDPVPTEAPTR